LTYSDKQDEKATMRQVTNFLFKPPEEKDEDDTWLDTRTDVPTKEMMKTLTYYRYLHQRYKCKSARVIIGILERLLISNNRMGRLEGVKIAQGKMPKEDVLLRGIADEIKEGLKEE